MDVPEYLYGHVAEVLATEMRVAEQRGMWVVVLGLRPSLDGNQWCFVWGENIVTGVTAYGSTPMEAMQNFEKAMYEKAPVAAKGEGVPDATR